MVPPCSDRIARVPPYSRTKERSTRTGLSPATARLSRRFRFSLFGHWPGPRSLATTSGVSVDVLSSGYVRCFSSPGSPRASMDSMRDTACAAGCPIRISSDQSSLATPRSFSQRATSFIASQCQGIHQMPLLRLIAVIPCRDKLPRTNGLLTRSSANRPKTLLGPRPVRVPRPINPVKQQSLNHPRTSRRYRRRQSADRHQKPLVEPTGIEPVTSSLQS